MQYKKEEIRDKIINSALIEFEKKGFSKASILNIAKCANVPVGNLYRYFSSKSELFTQIVRTTVTELPIIVKQIYDSEIKKTSNLKEIGDQIAKHIIIIHRDYGKQLLLLVDKSEGSEYQDFYQNLFKYVVYLIEEGAFKTNNSENKLFAEIIARGYLNGVFTIMREVEPKKMEEKMKQLSYYYFYDLHNRI